ncbi:MAG TPA: hypothetical protein V6C72_16615 [Chroococcales cyanobacterium]
MGLDSVELIIAIEEEFGLEIPNEEAEKLTTVGQTYEYLCSAIGAKPPLECLRNRMFYKIRRGLIEMYGVPRKPITLDARLQDVVPKDQLQAGWPYLELFTELKFPRSREEWPFFTTINPGESTIREIIATVLALNQDKLIVEPDSRDEVWLRLCNVIVQQTNVDLDEIRPGASFTRDLGID